MNYPYFIAKRISLKGDKSFTKVIVRIAIAAVMLSIAAMILTTAVLSGFKKEITEKVFGFWGHIHITDTSINRTFEQIPISKDDEYLNDIADIEWLKYQKPVKFFGKEQFGKYKTAQTQGGVHHLEPFAYAPGMLATSKEFGAIVLKGIDDSYDWDNLDNFIVEGRKLDFSGDGENEMVISTSTARTMQIEVGQRVQMSFIRDNNQVKRVFKVVGTYNSGLEEYDRNFALVHLTKVQKVLKWEPDQVSGIAVFLEDPKDLSTYNEYFYNEIIPARMYTESIVDKYPAIFRWLELQDVNEELMVVLMAVVAIINMITALLILILERTKMIGLLKTLGSTNWEIRKVFLYYAFYIILFGTILGNAVAIILGALQQKFKFLTLGEENYYLSYAPVHFDWGNILIINIASLAVILVALILPTLLVTSISPIKTIRFE